MVRKVHVAFVGAVLLLGCRKEPPPPIVEVWGFVRLEGQPLSNVEVRFVPMIEYGPEYTAKGLTDKAGRFQLTCKGERGACACENRVLVRDPEIPAHLRSESAQPELAKYLQSLPGRPLPSKYANLVSSPLSVEVRLERKEYNLDLSP